MLFPTQWVIILSSVNMILDIFLYSYKHVNTCTGNTGIMCSIIYGPAVSVIPELLPSLHNVPVKLQIHKKFSGCLHLDMAYALNPNCFNILCGNVPESRSARQCQESSKAFILWALFSYQHCTVILVLTFTWYV